MKFHTAYGLAIENMDIVVVEDSKPMQTILRSILLSFRVARVRVFDSVDEALDAMLTEPPNVILTDLRMEPTTGYQMLRMIRHRHMEPLCYVPLLFVTAHGTRALVDRALRSGAHHLLVKPVSPATLMKRLQWLARDDRPMVLENSGYYNIQGIGKMLDEQAARLQNLAAGRIQTQIAKQRVADGATPLEQSLAARAEGPDPDAKPEPPLVLPGKAGKIRQPGFAAVRSSTRTF
ncbi:two-component system chemotaxis response regulator CheY [Roseibium hamelinense]|uniref:Two-component system chemotaxis response regulator CheY n=1 Tax=Roseibium hamelinense TaxID=150831 RepID=A0A562THR4_9HYPH|nr:response regulator [Roseibium hamelinense]MTI45642.1 response regulator [Roseibium hamelinense]TWI93175.1 two-component system chemotaxis response regulator CheY [Roseibium hamelinense]